APVLALVALCPEGACAFPAGRTIACGTLAALKSLPATLRPRRELTLGTLRIVANALLPLEVALWSVAGRIFPAHKRLAVAIGALGEGSVAARRTLAERFWRTRIALRTLASRAVVSPEVTLWALAGRRCRFRRALYVRLLARCARLAGKGGLAIAGTARSTKLATGLAPRLAREFLSVVVHVAFASLRA